MPLLVFSSTNQALLMEKVLEDKGLSIDIVPLPPELSAECGLAIEFSVTDTAKVEALLIEQRIEYKSLGDAGFLC